ncbi:MAG: SpoIIE family protein phosphatase [Chloroflexi bacterium]|nr:SpoIIE family protein phosphatase [Chloroflexota bacterium]
MIPILRNIWQIIQGRRELDMEPAPRALKARHKPPPIAPSFEIAPDDLLIDFFQHNSGAIELTKLNFDSPALDALRTAGIQLVVPLVSQGELIGLLNVGKRLSEQDYSIYDHKLLENLASQAAPAVRVAQLVRQQQIETQARERLEHELGIARLIQQTLLPKDVPHLPGWQVAAFYQPARAVGGDFYDFLTFPDGLIGFIVGDVTDKGVPAALVMATTRSILRAAAERLVFPGQVLERANELLHADIPPKMFVTCLYALLDPTSGRLRYANAGHDLPYRCRADGVEELRATGMPLGLMPGMRYEEKETILAPGDTMLLYSDGLVEAHNPQREMFGFPRLRALLADHEGGPVLIDFLLTKLAEFTGADWEQEDDVTMLILQRYLPQAVPEILPQESQDDTAAVDNTWRTLAEFSLASELGNERTAVQRVSQAVEDLCLSAPLLERLKTAVAEATLNAIEHGNKNRPEVPVFIQVQASPAVLSVRITDQGGGQPIPEPEAPNLEAKLAGLQTPRGWGLFLIKNLMDEMRVASNDTHHTIELILYLEAEEHVRKTS